MSLFAWRIRSQFSAAVLCALITFLSAANVGTAAEVTIAGETVGLGGQRALNLVVEESEFQWPITVRRNDSEGEGPVEVGIDVTPLIGPGARPVRDQGLFIGEIPVEKALELGRLGQSVVHLSGSLPMEGVFKGELGLIVDKKRIPYQLTVERKDPAKPPVEMIGLTKEGRLAMTSDRSTFNWPVVIRRTDASTGDVAVTLRVSPFTGPSGLVIEPKLTKDGSPLGEKPLNLPQLGQELVQVVGDAAVPGLYIGEITTQVGMTRRAVPLELTRTRPDFDLKVDEVAKIRSTAGDGVTFQVRLLNATGTRREIPLPIIARLDRTDASGSTPVEVGQAGYQVTFSGSDGKRESAPLRIPADEGLDLGVTIKGLEQPGSYKGTLRFTAADRNPLDKAFEFAVRLPWWAAMIAIALGVAIAAGLRWYVQSARPRLELQRRGLVLRSKLSALVQAEGSDLTTVERRVLAFLTEQIDEASDVLAETGTSIAEAETVLANVQSKLPLLSDWITFRRRLDGLRPPDIATGVRRDLESVTVTLENAKATEAEIKDAETLLKGMKAKIEEAIKASILGGIKDIESAIGDFSASDQAGFADVRDALKIAESAANELLLQKAGAALDQARSGYAEAGARLLRRDVTTQALPPLGFTDSEWNSFTTEIRGQLDAVVVEPDAERRVERWTDTNRRYLLEVVRCAKSGVDDYLLAKVPGTESALNLAVSELAKAEVELAAAHLGKARTAYKQGIAEIEKVRSQLQTAGVQRARQASRGDALAPNAGADLPPSVIESAIGGVLPLPLGRDVTLKGLRQSWLCYDLLFSGIILILAVLTGLQLLYAGNPAFGWGDLSVAFLWGAGLHAIAGQTFQGLQGFAQQFR